MSSKTQTLRQTMALKTIFWSGLVAGILDGIAAAIVFYIWYKLTPGQVMQFIASGYYGTAAFNGSASIIFAGILFHFIIAYAIAVIYFYAYPKIGMLKSKAVLSGLIFGLLIWLVMNILIIPASNVQKSPFDLGLALVSITWHMMLVGLPVALITKKHYQNNAA